MTLPDFVDSIMISAHFWVKKLLWAPMYTQRDKQKNGFYFRFGLRAAKGYVM